MTTAVDPRIDQPSHLHTPEGEPDKLVDVRVRTITKATLSVVESDVTNRQLKQSPGQFRASQCRSLTSTSTWG